jgi:hypothetical protein
MPPDIGFLETLDLTETLIIIRKEEARSPARPSKGPITKAILRLIQKRGVMDFNRQDFANSAWSEERRKHGSH